MAGGYLSIMAGQFGIPMFLLLIFVIWSAVWKLLALWKAGRNNSPVWFIVLALVNTFGILEILYLFIFSEYKKKPRVKQRNSRSRRRR